jgi:hypothetical protein
MDAQSRDAFDFRAPATQPPRWPKWTKASSSQRVWPNTGTRFDVVEQHRRTVYYLCYRFVGNHGTPAIFPRMSSKLRA